MDYSNLNTFEIIPYPFSKEGMLNASKNEKGANWPVVYIISNDQKVYIGETSNFKGRFNQHLNNPSKQKEDFKIIRVVIDGKFNKSAVLDIEQTLIRLFYADKGTRFITNRNEGQNASHNYYQRELYQYMIPQIWNRLRSKDIRLAKSDYYSLIASDNFRYCPYTALTDEQNEICFHALERFIKTLKCESMQNGTQIITGSAGTGKTMLGLHLLNIICKINNQNINSDVDDENDDIISSFDYNQRVLHELRNYYNEQKNNNPDYQIKVCYVLAMEGIRKTLQKVIGAEKNKDSYLKPSLILGPLDVSKEKEPYDFVIVDEAHRLRTYKGNGLNKDKFKVASDRLGLDKPEQRDELDLIVKNSKFRVLFYDGNQTVSSGDIPDDKFSETINKTNLFEDLHLKSQMRCKGGDLFINYLDSIFDCKQSVKEYFANFKFLMYNNVNEMVDHVKSLNDPSNGIIARNLAGYSWKWNSKKDKDLYDIEIQGYKYKWNSSSRQGWILSKNAINEIGCIHTTQGFDLSYVGVIFGEEIDYDEKNNRIVIDEKRISCDAKAYNNLKHLSKEELSLDRKKFCINAYKVMMERGVNGCFVYVCNQNLRKYLSRFIEVVDPT